MSSRPFIIHSRSLAEGQSGELLRFTRESVQWEWMTKGRELIRDYSCL